MSDAESGTMLNWDRIQRIGSTPLDGLLPSVACRAVFQLKAAGRWFLKPEVVRIARTDAGRLGPCSVPPENWADPRPELAVGLCRILTINRFHEQTPLLRPCFVMPVQWREDVPHSPCLPPELTRLADQVALVLGDAPPVSGRHWGLWPARGSGFDRCDLSTLGMDCRSAWAPLAASLILAADGLVPDPEVWATGAWDFGQGILAVGGLEPKLKLVAERDARIIFVPESQAEETRRWKEHAGATFEIRPFQASPSDTLRQAIREYLARSGARPGLEEDFDVRVRYYLLQIDAAYRRRYYIEALLPELAEYYRSEWPRDSVPTHMVTIASDSPELIVLLAEATSARGCLILYTEDRRKPMNEAVADIRLRIPGCEITTGRITGDSPMGSEMKKWVSQFIATLDPSQVIFDLTPGTKEMSLILAMNIAPAGSWVFYLRHGLVDKKPVPSKKIPMIQRVTATTAAPPR